MGRNLNCSAETHQIERDLKKIERVRITHNFTLNIRQNSLRADTAAFSGEVGRVGRGRGEGKERKNDKEIKHALWR